MAFVRKHLPDKFYQEGEQRISIRNRIFREVVGNLIVHREFANAFPAKFIIEKDKVLSENWNRPHVGGVIDPANFSPYPKNPVIAKFFKEIGRVDELGSGIRNVNKYLPVYSNGATPTFIENDIFITVIPLTRITVNKKANVLLELAGINPNDMDPVLIDSIKNVEVPNEINKVDNPDELILKLGLSWYQNGVKLEKVRFLINRDIGIEDLKMELSIEEKGVKLLKNRSKNILKMLMYLVMPESMENLMEKMQFSSRSSFRDDYVKPLRDHGLINLTIPDKPRDPNQQYVISEKGKMFLTGFEI